VVGDGPGDLVEQVAQGGGVVDGGEGGEVAGIGLLGDGGAAVEIGDAFAQRLPGEGPAGGVVLGPEDFEVAGTAMVVSTRRTEPALSYILMELPCTQCLMRTPSGRPAGARCIRLELAVEPLTPEKAHDVRAVKVEHGMAQECGVDGGQRRRRAEQQIGGPLGLKGGPVVGLRPGAEDLGVERIEGAGNRIEGGGPGVRSWRSMSRWACAGRPGA